MNLVRETAHGTDPTLFVHPAWAERFPWLVQGTSGAERGFDLRLFGPAPTGDVLARWDRLRSRLDMPVAVHARQVHGARVLDHTQPGPAGLRVYDDADGHATTEPGLMLTVALADCAPGFVVDAERRAVALVHAGWRGTAAGVLTTGIQRLAEQGSRMQDLHVHVGPRICGSCYEVGPEVHTALGLAPPRAPEPVDLGSVLIEQAAGAGVPRGQCTASTWCTLCDPGSFFSHRGGSAGRQVALLGIRDR